LNQTRNHGFTLIELLIVLAVLAVIATMAVNSYRDYVLKSGRTEAMTALKELAQLEEEYYGNQDPGAYTNSLSALNYSTTTPNSLYQLGITTSPSVYYSIQATAINAQLADETCRTFRLNGMGVRSAQDANTSDTTTECWTR
jgi:type IV pilus assembly protein PilE